MQNQEDNGEAELECTPGSALFAFKVIQMVNVFRRHIRKHAADGVFADGVVSAEFSHFAFEKSKAYGVFPCGPIAIFCEVRKTKGLLRHHTQSGQGFEHIVDAGLAEPQSAGKLCVFDPASIGG